MSVACCQVKVSATSRSLFKSVVCMSVIEEPHRGGIGPLGLSSCGGGGGNF